MTLQDKVVSWYVKHYLIPKAQILDKPGFVCFNVSGKTPFFARQIIIPELFFILLEKKIFEEFGEPGQQKLYSLGKKFGYRFGLMANLSQKPALKEKDLPNYLEMITKFIEGTYGKNISFDLNQKKSIIKYYAENFIVCSELGYGYFLPVGAIAGLTSYIFNNPEIEAVLLNVETKGNFKSELICAPINELKNNQFTEINLKGLEEDLSYASINEIKKIESSTYSFSQFINSKVFSFKEGVILSKSQRYFIFEISGLHLIENEFNKDSKTKKLLESVSIETGKRIAEDFRNTLSEKLFIDLFTAFGWGELNLFEQNKKQIINAKYSPWTKFSKTIDFIILRGLIEGFLSVVLDKEINLITKEKDLSQGYLNLLFEEK